MSVYRTIGPLVLICAPKHRFWVLARNPTINVLSQIKEKYIKKKYTENFIGLLHIRVSTHVSTAYRDTKGTSHVRRRYVGIRCSYSSIRSSYSSYAEVLRFLCVHLKIRSTYVAGPIRRTCVTHTWYIRKQRGRYVVDT